MKVTKEVMFGLTFLVIITSGAAIQIGWIAVSIALGICALLSMMHCSRNASEMK